MIADDKESFIEAVITLYSNSGKSVKMGKNARELVLQQHNNELLVKQMIDFYKEVLN